MMTQWLQEAFDVPLVIQMTDDEKFLWKVCCSVECWGGGAWRTTRAARWLMGLILPSFLFFLPPLFFCSRLSRPTDLVSGIQGEHVDGKLALTLTLGRVRGR